MEGSLVHRKVLESFLNTSVSPDETEATVGAGQAPEGPVDGAVYRAPFPAACLHTGPPTWQTTSACQRPSISLQSSLADYRLSCYLGRVGRRAVGMERLSHFSPGFLTLRIFHQLGPYGCRLSFSAWMQTPKHPRPEKRPYCCLS